jgi:hypothetical protein
VRNEEASGAPQKPPRAATGVRAGRPAIHAFKWILVGALAAGLVLLVL